MGKVVQFQKAACKPEGFTQRALVRQADISYLREVRDQINILKGEFDSETAIHTKLNFVSITLLSAIEEAKRLRDGGAP